MRTSKVLILILFLQVACQVNGQDSNTSKDTLSQSTSVDDSASTDQGKFADVIALVNYRSNDSSNSFGGVAIFGSTWGNQGFFGLGVGYQFNQRPEKPWVLYWHLRLDTPLHLEQVYIYFDLGYPMVGGIGLSLPRDKLPQWSLQLGYGWTAFENECEKIEYPGHYSLSVTYGFEL